MTGFQTTHLQPTLGTLPLWRSKSIPNYDNIAVSQATYRMKSLKMSSNDPDNPFYKGLDYYQVLEVPKSAPTKDIKSAYRKAVSTWHPDKFPDDEAKKAEGNKRMEKINRAWYVLSDDDRRRRYDQFGESGVGTSASSEEQIKAGGGPGFGGMGGDVGDISDIFDAFFGGGQGARGGGRTQRNPNAPVPGKLYYIFRPMYRIYYCEFPINKHAILSLCKSLRFHIVTDEINFCGL